MSETNDENNDSESQCGKPCDPESGCEECKEYWERMVREGLWNREEHKWTEKSFYRI